MNNPGMRAILTLGLLALVMTPAHANQYVVEPMVDQMDSDLSEGFSQGELDQMLAPIALYPDALLSNVLIASTYPLEIVEAARWSRQNSHLTAEAAVEAVADKDWDPSVKALVAFPDLLARMDEELDWTRRLGDAVLYQESQVMDSIQFLRARADAAGSLADNEYTRVIRQEETIIIEPVRTRVVHVPVYDPFVVYGPWWRPAHPPVFWAAPAFHFYGHPGFWWGPGVHVHSGFFFSSFYWPHRSVVIVHSPRFHHAPRHIHGRHFVPGQRWKHNPVHRRGVTYRHSEVRQRFDQPRLRAGPPTRWPLESGTGRGGDRWTDRGGQRDRDGRHADRPGGQWRDGRADSSQQWRDRRGESGEQWRGGRATSGDLRGREDGSTRSGGTGRRTLNGEDEPRFSAGPRTVRPNLTGVERDTRHGAATRSSLPGAAARVQQSQRAAGTAGAATRSVTPVQRAPSAPRSAAPAQTQRLASPAPRASAPRGGAQSRAPSAPSVSGAAPAPRAPAAAGSRSRGDAAPSGRGAQGGAGGSSRRSGGGDRRIE